MRFHSRQNTADMSVALQVGGEVINRVSCCKFLGLHIQETLQWNIHATKLVKILNSVSYQIRNLRGTVELPVLRTVYFAYGASRLRYGIALWGCAPDAEAVFRAQKRIVRAIAGVSSRESCRHLFRRFRLLPLRCVYLLEVLLYAFRNRHSFTYMHELHAYNTRHNNIQLPFPRTERFKESPEYMGCYLYSRLPLRIRQSDREEVFKNIFWQFF